MAKERKGKQDLDSILSEINSNIKKEPEQAFNEEKKIVEKKSSPQHLKSGKKSPKEAPTKKEIPAVDELSVKKPKEDTQAVRFIAVSSSETSEDINPSETENKDNDKNAVPINVDIENHVTKNIRRKNPKLKKSKRHKRTAALGALVTLFVVIGIVASVIGIFGFAKQIINNTALKSELAQEIFPFAIIDIPEFDHPSKLDNNAIIASAIWEFIIDEPDKAKYPKDDLGSIYVPAIDIEYYVRRLYGNDVKIQHQSVDDTNVHMSFEEGSRTYSIESTPKFLPYRPRVDKISKSGDIYTLEVSYILPDVMWSFGDNEKVEKVDKTMQFVLKKNKDSYQVLSVKLLSVAGAIAPSSQPPIFNREEESDPIEEQSQQETDETQSKENEEDTTSQSSESENNE